LAFDELKCLISAAEVEPSLMETTVPPVPAQITGVVLCGGLGSRMNPTSGSPIEKALLPFRGRPMLSHVLERFSPQVKQVMLNANRRLAEYEAFGHQVITDERPDHPGPLAGLHAALLNSPTDWIQTVPCDSPCLPSDLVTRLCGALATSSSRIAMACSDGRAQPVFALVHRSLLGELERYLDGGGRKIDVWFERHAAVELWFDDPKAFVNLNTPDELKRLEACS
jgi:molybdopterin-guanine dinucleotide biosynthesis protein A